MSNLVHSSSSRGKAAWLGAAALAALIAGGAVESGFVPPAVPAYAQAPIPVPTTQPIPSFADVVEKVKPAVVSVRVKANMMANRSDDGDEAFGLPDFPPGSPMERFFHRFQDGRGGQGYEFRRGPRRNAEAQGSGFFISADGYVVTNNHVVDHASEVQVTMDDGRTLDAKIVGTDPKTDLAVLKVKEGGNFPYVPFAAKTPRVGDWVVAIGNPFGLGGTVTAGIVSARGRDIGAGPYDDFLQIDAPVNRGNSGGPTFNLNGEVVGINTAIASPSGGSVGIAFAIPSDEAQKVVASLKDNGAVSRGFIGVQIRPVTKDIAEAMGMTEPKGALVAETVRGGPAEKAGLKRGDTIVAVEGQPIREPKDLSRRIAAFDPGKSVSLTVLRDGKERTVTVEIGRQNDRA
jgi:serine protease Do